MADEPVWVHASRWARSNKGIGISVSLGSDAGYSADIVKEFFETNFKENFDVPVVAFIETSEKPGSVVTYFYLEVGWKPLPFQIAVTQETLDKLINEYQAAISRLRN